jgi:hypothetical protein
MYKKQIQYYKERKTYLLSLALPRVNLHVEIPNSPKSRGNVHGKGERTTQKITIN